LHVQDMLCCHLDQAVAVSPKRTNRANESGRPKTGTQQSHRMEVLKPLAIGNVGLPAGNILHVLRIDKAHIHATGLQDLIHRDPVHAGGLHRD
jgi:hypothetical protein